MSKRALLTLPLLLILMLLAAQCSSGQPAAPAGGEQAAPAAEAEATTAPAEEAAPAAGGVEELKILWAQWDPADYLQEIGSLYEEETGIKVTVVQEPWQTFSDRTFAEFAAGGDSFDIVVGDSQWFPQATTQGHYVNLTDLIVGEGIDQTLAPATLVYYGEYPAGSGEYWGYPTEGDAVGWAYRKDLFENPDEMAAFEAEYGYPLAVPETWDQLMDIAKFFTRPDQGLYGAGIYTQKDYDAATMGYQNVFFSYSGRWGDPETNEVLGIANSPEAIAALEYYRELYQCCSPPGMSNAFFQETNDAFISGQAAMIMNYFAFFPALASEAISPFAADTGFFSNPVGPNGESHSALGGQGMSIVSYVSPERQEAAKEFIRWFAQEEIQQEWAFLGGYTCNSNVLASPEFLESAPFNAAFAESMLKVMDYWNNPVFGQLLEVTQRELTGYIVPAEVDSTAEEALTRMAEEHDAILREAGLIQ